MKMQRQFGITWVHAVGLVAILAVFTVLINLPWFDERLHSDLNALVSPDPVSMEDNVYPMIYGLPASQEKSFAAAGRSFVGALRERFEQGEVIVLSEDERNQILGDQNLEEEWRSIFQSLGCNSRLSLDCADRLISDAEAYAESDSRLELLLARYEEILRTPRFEENQAVDGNTPLPSYGLLMQVSRIRLAISYRQDSNESFIGVVEKDLTFWRMILRDSRTLIGKMVALAGFRNDLDFASTLIRHHDLTREETARLRTLLRPLTSAELDLSETFLAELRIAALTKEFPNAYFRNSSKFAHLFSQGRATLNEYYLTTTLPIQRLASLDAVSYYRQHGYEQLPYTIRKFPPPLYNLGGKFALKRIAQETSMQDYISRMHDVNGRVALVSLQVEIEESTGKSVGTIVKSSRYKNPYTGEPFRYDASLQTIGFDCLPSKSTDMCAVDIGQIDN